MLNRFSLQIADGQRELIRSHSVKKRHFIGNTSMDAGLSFIMANHAKVKANDLVYDPFVGTGEEKSVQIAGFEVYYAYSFDQNTQACSETSLHFKITVFYLLLQE